MAAQGASVLADLGSGWLQCQDQLGVFYFNQFTQQSLDVLPTELASAQQQPAYAPSQQLQALSQQQQQPYAAYVQQQKLQSYSSPAQLSVQPNVQSMKMSQPQAQVQYLQQAQAQPQLQYAQQGQPQAQCVQQAQSQPQVQYLQQTPSYQPIQQAQVLSVQQAQAQPQMQYVQQTPSYQPQAPIIQQVAPQQAQSSVKLEVGEWLVCEDAAGEFYHHVPTGQSFDQAPAQLVALIGASQRPQVPISSSTTAAMQAYGQQQFAGNVQYVQYG